ALFRSVRLQADVYGRLKPAATSEGNAMKRFSGTVALSLLVLASTATTARAGQAAGAGGCDRACLGGIADRYLAALVAHNPANAPMAPNAKFTEQAKVLPIGEGL